jgi:hypothetical protein
VYTRYILVLWCEMAHVPLPLQAPSQRAHVRSVGNHRIQMAHVPVPRQAPRLPNVRDFGVLFTLGISTPPPPWYQGTRFTTDAERKQYYLQELLRAVASVRKSSPTTPITVFTDDFSVQLPQYVNRVRLNTSGIRESGELIYALRHSPYNRSLIMDLDVTVCCDLTHTADFLTDFDAAFVIEPPSGKQPARPPQHNPGCNRRGPFHGCLTRVEANLGFLMLKRNKRTDQLLSAWQARHRRDGRSAQNALAAVLARESAVRFLPLPYEYNARLNGAVGPLSMTTQVVVLHARGLSCADVNGSNRLRVLDRVSPTKVGMLEAQDVKLAMRSLPALMRLQAQAKKQQNASLPHVAKGKARLEALPQ